MGVEFLTSPTRQDEKMITQVLNALLKNRYSQFVNLANVLVYLFIIAGIAFNLRLPLYIFDLTVSDLLENYPNSNTNKHSSAAKDLIRALIKTQKKQYLMSKQFHQSIHEFNLDISPNSNVYSYRVVSMMPIRSNQVLEEPLDSKADVERVVMIVQAKDTKLKSYIGVVYAWEKDEISQVAAVCEIDRYMPLPTMMPILMDVLELLRLKGYPSMMIWGMRGIRGMRRNLPPSRQYGIGNGITNANTLAEFFSIL